MSEAAKHILIVDDDRALRTAAETALTRAGYKVAAAADGREALAFVKLRTPDLIVLDLLMPSPTGLDVLRALRADERTRAIPVIVLSNSTMQRVVDEVETLGADYIAKAKLSLRDLRERVDRRLAEVGADAPDAAAPPAPYAPSAPSALSAPSLSTPSARRSPGRVAAIDVTPAPREDDGKMACAGCGSSVWPRFVYCPYCGRRLEAPTSPAALTRRVR